MSFIGKDTRECAKHHDVRQDVISWIGEVTGCVVLREQFTSYRVMHCSNIDVSPDMQRRPILFAALACLLAMPAWAQTTPTRVRGTISALEDKALTIEDRNGDPVRITLAPNYGVTAIVPTTLDAVKPGSTIGIVGFGPPTHQRAAVVSIFPPGATINESQFPWDSQKDSVMTNAPVVSEVLAENGRVLTVTVKGEKIEVDVPQNALIQTSEPGTTAMLVPGAKVLIFAQKAADGTISASRVNVGKDGYTPAN